MNVDTFTLKGADQPEKSSAMKKNSRFEKISVDIVAYGLLLTGLAKFISIFGHAHVLDAIDPILEIKFRLLFGIGGLIEVVFGFILLLSKHHFLKTWIIIALFASFLFYHIAAITGGISANVCPCLGNIYDIIPIQRRYIDYALLGFLGYGIVVGIYLISKSGLNRQTKYPPAD